MNHASTGKRIAVVEDHVLQRRRTEEIVHAHPQMTLVWSGETLPGFVDWCQRAPRSHHPHLLILDLQVDQGVDVDPALLRHVVSAGLKVLVVSALARPELVRQVLRAGVGGVVGKRDSEATLVAAMERVVAGRGWFTPETASVIAGDLERPALSDQEERALILYASGLTRAAVAQALNVRPETVKTYLDRVKAKYSERGLEVRTKLDLNWVAVQHGYLSPHDVVPHVGDNQTPRASGAGQHDDP